MTIRTRILGTFFVVAALLGGTVIYVLTARRQMNTKTEELRQQVTEPLAWANQLKAANDWELTWVVGGIRPEGDTGNIRGKGSPEYRAKQEATFIEMERLIAGNIAALEALSMPAEPQALLKLYKLDTSAIQGTLAAELGRRTPAPIDGAAAAPSAQLVPLMWERSADAQQLAAYFTRLQESRQAELEARYAETRRNALLALSGGFGLAVVAALVIADRIVKPVRRTVGVLESVAGGDLTPRLDAGSDEIGHMADALNRTLDQIGGIIEAIDASANELAESSSGFTERSTELATAAASVAGDADAASTSVHLIGSGVATVARTTATLGTALDEIATETARAADLGDHARAVAGAATEAVGRLRDGAGRSQPDRDGSERAQAARAADALDELTRTIDELRGLHGRISASVDGQDAISHQINGALAEVATSSSQIGGRLDAVAAAVSLTSQFIDETRTDAEHLAGLSRQLEALTAIFRHQRGDGTADETTEPLPLAAPTAGATQEA